MVNKINIIKKYIIDGNNVIGKMPELFKLQIKDKQASREKLAFMLEKYFIDKKCKISLHFDGYQNLPLKISKIKIIYSDNLTADDKIKEEIEKSKNRKNVIVVTSDNNLREFARVCSCGNILSEDFGRELYMKKNVNEEEKRIEEINDVEEFKKLFNVKDKEKE